MQALTTPLARLPGIARNDRRATIFVGRSCPPKLYFENSGNNRFLRQTVAHSTPYALLILRSNLPGQSAKWLSSSIKLYPWSQCFHLHCIQFEYMISQVLHPDLNYYWHTNANKTAAAQMVINRYSTKQCYRVSCRNGHSTRLQSLYCVNTARLWWNTGPWHGLLMS